MRFSLINKALHLMMLMLAMVLMPHSAHAQKAVASASAKIITQKFSTKDLPANADYQDNQNAEKRSEDMRPYVQQYYQSKEKERPCETGAQRIRPEYQGDVSNKKEEKKCLIVMIELQ